MPCRSLICVCPFRRAVRARTRAVGDHATFNNLVRFTFAAVLDPEGRSRGRWAMVEVP